MAPKDIQTPMNWKLGDRVTREIYMDDGTWVREGDECLKRSPLKHGEVIAIDKSCLNGPVEEFVHVRWDDGTVAIYLPHGIDRELPDYDPVEFF